MPEVADFFSSFTPFLAQHSQGLLWDSAARALAPAALEVESRQSQSQVVEILLVSPGF